MYDMKINEIDKYVVMSYYDDMVNGIPSILYNFNVDEIYMPMPRNNAEEEILLNINYDLKINKCNTKIIFFEQTDNIIRCKDFSISPFHRSTDENVVAFTIFYKDKFYIYLSSGMLNDENKNIDETAGCFTTTLIEVVFPDAEVAVIVASPIPTPVTLP